MTEVVTVRSYLAGQGGHTQLVLRVRLQGLQCEAQQVGLLVQQAGLEAGLEAGLALVTHRPVVEPVADLVLGVSDRGRVPLQAERGGGL